MSAENSRDELAKKHFPARWGIIKNAPGKSKARNNVRKAAEYAERREELKANGHSCADCSCLGIYPEPVPARHVCLLDSDFHGYAITELTWLCHKWRTS